MQLVFTPFGHHVRSGAGIKFHRWIRLGAFGFQPVELVKLGMIIYTSNFLISKCERVKSFTQGVLPNLIILALVFFLLYVQPDFGSAVLLSLVIILLLITTMIVLLQALLLLQKLLKILVMIMLIEHRQSSRVGVLKK